MKDLESFLLYEYNYRTVSERESCKAAESTPLNKSKKTRINKRPTFIIIVFIMQILGTLFEVNYALIVVFATLREKIKLF